MLWITRDLGLSVHYKRGTGARPTPFNWHCALHAGADTPTAKFFINCLAEPAEEVAQYLVPRIRKVPQEARSIGGSMSQVKGHLAWSALKAL